jgi:hypothetical protein
MKPPVRDSRFLGVQIKQSLVMKEGENICEGFVSKKRGASTFLNARSFYPLLATLVGSSVGTVKRTVPNCTFPASISS